MQIDMQIGKNKIIDTHATTWEYRELMHMYTYVNSNYHMHTYARVVNGSNLGETIFRGN